MRVLGEDDSVSRLAEQLVGKTVRVLLAINPSRVWKFEQEVLQSSLNAIAINSDRQVNKIHYMQTESTENF